MTDDKILVRIVNKSPFENPAYASIMSAGCDLQANIKEPLAVVPGEIVLVPTGIFISLPKGFEAQIRSRSGLTLNHGIVVANGIGTIDADYRGEIKVILTNISKEEYRISAGERIAQMVISEIKQAVFTDSDELDDTERSDGGFGHSGKD